MNKQLLLFLLTIVLSACGENKSDTEKEDLTLREKVQGTANYPEDLKAIFDAHGGIIRWKNMKTLYFEQGSAEDLEKHTIDLASRKSLTETMDYTLGYDGNKAWLVQDSTYMEPERATFMHNLMFYFLAMPFVLGDEGINYSPADTLRMEGANYPGIKIAYDSGVGVSDKDEYIVYSDPKTHKMTWLAYIATFGKEKRSEDFSFIKYDNWKEVNRLVFPTLLQWYEVEDGKPTNSLRSEQLFEQLKISPQEMNQAMFEKPEIGSFTISE